jgi:ABC-type multidrug transport system fused ATPase/permease subunit
MSLSAAPNTPAAEAPRPRKRRNADFWRACRFLGPYRRMVAASILCALVVGAVFTSGLGAALPIFKVLLQDQAVADWVDRQIIESRVGISLGDDAAQLLVARVTDGTPAAKAELSRSDVITGAEQAREPQQILSHLAQAQGTVILTLSGGQTRRLELPELPWYLSLARRAAARVPRSPVAAIATVFAFIFALAVIGSTVRFFQEHLSDRSAILAVNDIRKRLYDHVLHVPLAYFGQRGTSDVTSRLVQDAMGLQEGFKTVLAQAIQEPIKAAMALGLSLMVSWQLTLFIVLFAPIMGVLIKKFGTKMRRASRRALQESSTMLGQIEGTLLGIRVVKAARAERFERRRYRSIMRGLTTQQIRMSIIDTMSAPVIETLALLVVGTVVIYAAYLVKVAHRLDNAEFFLVMACLMGMSESLRKIGKVNNHLQRSSAAAGRVFEALDMPVERPRALASSNRSVPPARIKIPAIQREVRFENATFTYPNALSPAVDNVSLVVPKGQSVAVVGRNGSGKTTLLAMLPRFYDPQSGRICIDGTDIRSVTLGSLRRQIAVVTQDPVIFSGTIAQNIAYGLPLASRHEIMDAARRAFAHDFILEKPDGYDTPLGEMGGQLSGGQKQRINIARAILRQAPILILDEATSQVDAESEHLIQQAIESLMHERTTFVIAHRFSTILSADTIVVMERGRIVGQGRHDELLRTCPTYEQLYERQLIAPNADAPSVTAG